MQNPFDTHSSILNTTNDVIHSLNFSCMAAVAFIWNNITTTDVIFHSHTLVLWIENKLIFIFKNNQKEWWKLWKYWLSSNIYKFDLTRAFQTVMNYFRKMKLLSPIWYDNPLIKIGVVWKQKRNKKNSVTHTTWMHNQQNAFKERHTRYNEHIETAKASKNHLLMLSSTSWSSLKCNCVCYRWV